MAKAVIIFQLSRRETEADGSKCLACADNVYGRAWELVLMTRSGAEAGMLEGQFCQSCAEAINVKEIEA